MSVVAEATKVSRTAAIAASAAVHSQDHLSNGRVDTPQRETAALVPATSIEISQTGRLLMRILAIASGTADTSNAGTIKHPLLNVAVTDPTAMASALASSLRNAVEFSGLFYESHLAQWVVDARQEECVLREPQAALSPEETSFEGERIAQLVHAQLDVLENRQIHWQGQAWPGTPFSLRIDGQDTHFEGNTSEEESASAAWCSHLSLELATLGTVEVRLRLRENNVQFSLQTLDSEVAALLKSHRQLLSNAMHACGLQLDQMQVAAGQHDA
jgi:hypothetical protein